MILILRGDRNILDISQQHLHNFLPSIWCGPLLWTLKIVILVYHKILMDSGKQLLQRVKHKDIS